MSTLRVMVLLPVLVGATALAQPPPPVCTALAAARDGAVDPFGAFEATLPLILGGVLVEVESPLDPAAFLTRLGLVETQVTACPGGRSALWVPGVGNPAQLKAALEEEGRRVRQPVVVLRAITFGPVTSRTRLRARCATKAACAEVSRPVPVQQRCAMLSRWAEAEAALVGPCASRSEATTRCVLWAELQGDVAARKACVEQVRYGR